ncbi:type VI secretion protein [Bradyrhizobium brasilense]|uniref:type VI secretion protein n=1 Tax=Bradyrhizobium brasilense TaxID=1419277 RepID=UPI001E295C35|nr:type VI secretion protein [Bradyrhizobium brasilense]
MGVAFLEVDFGFVTMRQSPICVKRKLDAKYYCSVGFVYKRASALAKGPDCRAIAGTTARLACYDAAYPPKLEKPAIAEGDAGRPPYKDPFAAEEARTAAKLKTICRGC